MVSDRQRPSRPSFRVSKVVGPVVRNGLGPDLANSFLVMCSKSEGSLKQTLESGAVYYGNGDRKKPYLKAITFDEQEDGLHVTRRPLTDIAPPSNASFVQVFDDDRFIEGTHWGSKLQDVMVRKNWKLDDIEEWARVWFDAFKAKANISSTDALGADTQIDGSLLDAIPKNLIVDAACVGHFFDLEWQAKTPLKFGYILVRGLADALTSVESASGSKQAADVASLVHDLGKRLGVSMPRSEVLAHLRQEGAFQKEVSYKPGVGNKLRLVRSHISHRNVNRLDMMMRGLKRAAYVIRHPLLSLSSRL